MKTLLIRCAALLLAALAAMAHAAWEVTTDGIEVANRLADLIRAGLAEVDR